MGHLKKLFRTVAVAALAATPIFLAGCGQRTLRVELIPVEERLVPQVIESDPGAFLPKIAIVNLSGMIANTRGGGLFGAGSNPVSDLRETLKAIEADDVKAVVLRMQFAGRDGDGVGHDVPGFAGLPRAHA